MVTRGTKSGLGHRWHRWQVWLLAVGTIALTARPLAAQVGPVPSLAYTTAMTAYAAGNYPAALGGFQGALRGSIQTPAGRWIDSIYCFTMSGECLYHMGKLDEALTQYNQALTLYATNSNWMLSTQFTPIVSAGQGARAVVPWGSSQRVSLVGQFPPSYLMSQGQVNNNNVLFQGGAIQQAVLTPVAASEIARCTTLAIRRRHELMGPVCKYDPLTTQIINLLSRRPAPPNHWSQAWVDVELGTAQAAAGNAASAIATLERAVVINGEFDHPLTGPALFELGLLALEAGDYAKAGQYFLETTYAAVTFNDPALLEEAFRYAQLVHLMTRQPNVYPPLGQALNWSRSRAMSQLQASLAILLAESFAVQGETTPAVNALAEARSVLARGPLATADIGARFNLVSALIGYQSGQASGGDAPLKLALAYQESGSLWMFQIHLADKLYLNGEVYDRAAAQLYELLLRDPTALDWAQSPLESLSVLVDEHSVSYEHWFEATLKQAKDPELLLEIADRTKRHRYLSSLPLGGRLLGLRWTLEGPKELLNEQSLAQRQDLLTRFPHYADLDGDEQKLSAELAAKPVVEESNDARREQARQLGQLASLGEAQEVILHEIAVRREGADLVFPPLRKTKDLQEALPDGHLLLAFFATSSNNLYGFLFSKDKYAKWSVSLPAVVNRHLTAMLREMGNTDHNHQLSLQDLAKPNWKKSAGKLLEALLDKSDVDLTPDFQELIVVPDGQLWYLPFEALPVGPDPQTAPPLLSRVRVRYAPTVGLAIPYHHLQKPEPKPTGIVLGKLYPHDDDAVTQNAREQLERSVERPVVLPRNPMAPSSMTRTLLDGLIVWDDIDDLSGNCANYGWSPMQLDSGKPGGSLASWMKLPWGGPEWIVLPGFHTPAENGLRKTSPCNEIFTAICGLMSTGVRTILISRWRLGGQGSLDLVREFAQELPHSPPADAWQRAVQLLMQQPLDLDAEPRLKKTGAGTEPPPAEHPFFWAAYMLVDSGQLAEGKAPPPPPAVNVKPIQAAPAPGDIKAGAKPLAGAAAPGQGAMAGPRIIGGPGAAAGPGPMAGQAPIGGGAPGDPAAGGPAVGGQPVQPGNTKAGGKKPTRAQRKAAKAPPEEMQN